MRRCTFYACIILHSLIILLGHEKAGLGTRQFFSFATKATRQCKRASVTSNNTENVQASVSKWSSHNKNIHIAIINNLLA